MNPVDPAAHAIVDKAHRGQGDDPLGLLVPLNAARQSGPTKGERDAVEMFLIRATSDMLRRMRDGLRRGWGDSWKRSYSDDEVSDRLRIAGATLTIALRNYRAGHVGIDEVRKRAADVADQAFMLADPERLRNNDPSEALAGVGDMPFER